MDSQGCLVEQNVLVLVKGWRDFTVIVSPSVLNVTAGAAAMATLQVSPLFKVPSVSVVNYQQLSGDGIGVLTLNETLGRVSIGLTTSADTPAQSYSVELGVFNPDGSSTHDVALTLNVSPAYATALATSTIVNGNLTLTTTVSTLVQVPEFMGLAPSVISIMLLTALLVRRRTRANSSADDQKEMNASWLPPSL